LNKIFIGIILSIISLFAQYKTESIDTHKGKTQSLTNGKIDFARKGLDYLLKSKTLKVKHQNKTKKNHITIESITNLEDIKID
jgi:hypothetical protein